MTKSRLSPKIHRDGGNWQGAFPAWGTEVLSAPWVDDEKVGQFLIWLYVNPNIEAVAEGMVAYKISLS